jgi:hypothetical protein
MNRSVQVFLACAFGAFVGALVALQFRPLFWWVGLLVGGGTGYLSFEFQTVVAAVKHAWKATINWQPDRQWWREAPMKFGCAFVYLMTPALVFMGLCIAFIAAMTLPFAVLGYNSTANIATFFDVTVIFTSVFMTAVVLASFVMTWVSTPLERLQKVVRYRNPVNMFFRVFPRLWFS